MRSHRERTASYIATSTNCPRPLPGGTLIRLKVDHHDALAAVDALEVTAVPAGHGARRGRPGEPGHVPLRRLDLDHVGAEVGEQHRGVRAGERVGEVDDPYPV